MKIYVLNFNDQECYAAYTSFEKAKEVLWEAYCDDCDAEVRAKYADEDLKTLEEGYIVDYGWIRDVELVDE